MENEITYTWEIVALECIVDSNGLHNAVDAVHWRYHGTNSNNITASYIGVTNVGQPNPEEFIDYENLTTEIVAQWLETIVSLEDIRENISNEIHRIEHPTRVTLPLPTGSNN
jgi:hypothetical protein